MSKLDGNERWKTKMLLPEHHEQYQARNETPKNNRPTQEELTLIRDSVLLPFMIIMANNSVVEIQNSKNVLRSLIEGFLQLFLNKVREDQIRINRELSKRNIRVHKDVEADMVMYYKYYCRGYSEKFGIMREVVRSEIRVRLKKYAYELTSHSMDKPR
ncbi:hypothetical protein [Cohnella silvisoli]|uniref:Uncharacterized protein n=1 Tax=Cohnella silvisoli TaxID=2873699 RepID=A0ABV1KV81_9BACL|nr:hypothetical protein [Cohnella silvisoli]MCD9023287.1 hypothetical protein [Cohnella silvisoli]